MGSPWGEVGDAALHLLAVADVARLGDDLALAPALRASAGTCESARGERRERLAQEIEVTRK